MNVPTRMLVSISFVAVLVIGIPAAYVTAGLELFSGHVKQFLFCVCVSPGALPVMSSCSHLSSGAQCHQRLNPAWAKKDLAQKA